MGHKLWKTSVSDLLAGDFCVMPQFIVCIEYVISLMISSLITNSLRWTFELAFVEHRWSLCVSHFHFVKNRISLDLTLSLYPK